MASLQDALGQFNTDKPGWYGWTDSSLGMIYSNVKLNDDTATMPTEEEVNAKIAELEIQENRKYEYPSIEDQLDYIYHNGLTKWKSDIIKPVKDKYPKG
jgi:hypothetical protein